MARLRVTKKRADSDKEKGEEDAEKEEGVSEEAKRQGCQEGKDQFEEEHLLAHHNTLEPCKEKVDADAGEDGPAEDGEDPQDDQQDRQGCQNLGKVVSYPGVAEHCGDKDKVTFSTVPICTWFTASGIALHSLHSKKFCVSDGFLSDLNCICLSVLKYFPACPKY